MSLFPTPLTFSPLRVCTTCSVACQYGRPLLVGEWCNAMHSYDASLTPAFGKAQLQSFSNASLGWFFWSLKHNISGENSLKCFAASRMCFCTSVWNESTASLDIRCSLIFFPQAMTSGAGIGAKREGGYPQSLMELGGKHWQNVYYFCGMDDTCLNCVEVPLDYRDG